MELKIIIFSLCLFTAVFSCIIPEEYGDLQPELAQIKVGTELTFNCTVNEEYVDDGTIDVRSIFFDKDEKPLDKKYMKIVDPYTVQIKIPNASLEYNGMYSCKFNNSKLEASTICYSDAEVGVEPLPVIDFNCIYHYRQILNCSWTKPNNWIKPTNYMLYHYFQTLEEEKKPCVNHTENYCLWDPQDTTLLNDKYFLEMIGTNSLGVTKQYFTINQSSIVKLPPPRDFKFDSSTNTLQWKAPEYVLFEENLKRTLIYKIYIINEANQIIDTVIHSHKNTRETLKYDNLKPFTVYTFNITCKINDSSNPFWSDMVSITNRTKAMAPFFPPEIIDQSFETKYSLNIEPNIVNVTIYWKEIPLSDRNGPDFGYFVQYRKISQPDWENNTVVSPNISLVLESDMEYLFRIFSKNSEGLSMNYSIFSLPPKKRILWNNESDTLANMIKVLKFENGRYNIEWDSIDSAIIKDYTVFWCPTISSSIYNDHDKCLHSIHWYTTNHKSFMLNAENHELRIGISHNSFDNQTTGIIWAKCNADMEKKLVNRIYWWIPSNDISSNSVKVHWKLSCETQRIFVNVFQIKFCSNESGCQYVNVNKNESQYLIDNLEPHTKYNITVLLPFPRFHSESIPIPVETDSGTPQSPENLTVTLVNEKEFHLEWSNPESASESAIQYFSIKSDGPEPNSSQDWDNKNYKELCKERTCKYVHRNENLKPYSKYSFTVKACKKNNDCSKSNVVYKTKPSSPGYMMPPEIESRGDKLHVNFKTPAEPNGPIDYYFVKLYEGQNVLMEQNFTGHYKQQVDLKFDTCKHRENKKEYFLSVKAANIFEDKVLSNEFTEKMPIPLNCPQPLYSLLILFIVGIVCFSLILYFLLYNSYKLFRTVKQKNEEFTLNIAMEDQTFKDQYYKADREMVDSNNVSDSSLVDSDSANANTSSNTINDAAIFSSEEIQQPSNNHSNNSKHTKGSGKNYIRYLSNKFCSSDSGVSDMNHHDNLEYFYNQDETKQPFLKSTSPNPIPLANGGNGKFNNSKSAPSSNLPSPEHVARSSQNNSTAKQTYVLIPSSSNSKYLPHSHTTDLPNSYGMNQV